MERVVLVAGASSGLGRATAEALAADGFLVYAGARSFAQGTAPPKGCRAVALDVTDDASAEAAVSRALAEAGRLDALVNCAAVLSLGACEETGDAELRRVFEAGFFGAARMTRACLPALRESRGRVVQFSSLNGRFGVPFQGAYTASKHAIEGFSECLAMETRPFGVRVTLVEPGDCRGGSARYRYHAERAADSRSPYAARYAAGTARIARDEAGGLDPARVGAAVCHILRAKHPPARAVVAGPDQRLALRLHGLLPGNWFYKIIDSYYAGAAKEGKR